MVHPDDPLARPRSYLRCIRSGGFRSSRRGKLVGLVTLRDLLNHALRTGDVLTDPLTDLIPSFGADYLVWKPWFDGAFQCDEERRVLSPGNLTSFRDILAVPSNG